MSRRTGSLLLLGATLCAGAVTFALLVASRSAAAHPLSLVAAHTPRFIRGYDTSGRYPNVSGAPNLRETNAALRQAILDDQDVYAKSAREVLSWPDTRRGGWHGLYRTWVNRNLTSASTTVVSTLIPTLKLYPGGNDGATWISATVDVRTGKRVTLSDLLSSEALPEIARSWAAAFMRQFPRCDASCRQWWRAYRPGYPAKFATYENFALLPSGLAIGTPQYPAGPRNVEIVPYRVIRPYLTPLGKTLVAGVRPPLPRS